MKKELKIFAEKFVKDIKNESAAIFAGAGLSKGSGAVDWKNLLTDLAKELNLDIHKENDLVALTQFYYNEYCGRGSINNLIVDKFSKDLKPNENHKILASLPIKSFWTTNYDDLIEKELENNGKIVDIKSCDQHLAVNTPRRDSIVYKMHGDARYSHDAVITKDDYEGYNEKRPLFSATLQGELTSKTFLFIGFSFEDPNIDYILSRIRVLLGTNKREHYCFFKEIEKSDCLDDEDYQYKKIRQQHKITDLKRYSIKTLLINDYGEITETLKFIQSNLKMRNIFISGAATNYGRFNEESAAKLVFDLSLKLVKQGYKIISGFGLGIGSSVINGVLNYIYESNKRHIDDYLILRPFPQNINDPDERKKLWKKYREDMIKEAGIAIFIFGNKTVDQKVVISDGMIEEFEISKSLGVKIIPIASTGGASKEIYEKIKCKTDDYYNDSRIISYLDELNEESILEKEIIEIVLKILNELN